MDTPSNSNPLRSWAELTHRAAAERPPAVDVRAALLQQIEAELASNTVADDEDFTASLLAFVRTTWMRVAMSAVCAATLVVATLGWRAAESLSEPLLYAAPNEAESSTAPAP